MIEWIQNYNLSEVERDDIIVLPDLIGYFINFSIKFITCNTV